MIDSSRTEKLGFKRHYIRIDRASAIFYFSYFLKLILILKRVDKKKKINKLVEVF